MDGQLRKRYGTSATRGRDTGCGFVRFASSHGWKLGHHPGLRWPIPHCRVGLPQGGSGRRHPVARNQARCSSVPGASAVRARGPGPAFPLRARRRRSPVAPVAQRSSARTRRRCGFQLSTALQLRTDTTGSFRVARARLRVQHLDHLIYWHIVRQLRGQRCGQRCGGCSRQGRRAGEHRVQHGLSAQCLRCLVARRRGARAGRAQRRTHPLPGEEGQRQQQGGGGQNELFKQARADRTHAQVSLFIGTKTQAQKPAAAGCDFSPAAAGLPAQVRGADSGA